MSDGIGATALHVIRVKQELAALTDGINVAGRHVQRIQVQRAEHLAQDSIDLQCTFSETGSALCTMQIVDPRNRST